MMPPPTRWFLSLLLLMAVWNSACAEYQCLCSYAVETVVHATPTPNGAALGYMYEFDCKPMASASLSNKHYFVIQYEHQVGYIEPAGSDTINQTCQGYPPTDDIVTTTMAPTHHTSHLKTTSTQPPTTATTAATTPPTTATTPSTTTTAPTTAAPSTTTPTTAAPTTPAPTTQAPTTESTTTTTSPAPTTPSTTPTTRTTTTPTTTMPTTPTPTTTPIPTTTTNPPTFSTTQSALWNEANVTGTPLQYVGVGYNLMTGTPLSALDTGLLTSQRIFQLTLDSSNNVIEVDSTYSAGAGTCTQRKASNLANSPKAAQRLLLQYFNVTGSNSTIYGTDLQQGALTYDPAFQSKISHFGSNKNLVYRDDVTTCSYGSIRYKMEKADEHTFHITKEFADAVCHLPKTMSDPMPYMNFLQQWGTHVTTSVDVGTMEVKEYQTTLNDVFHQVEHWDPHLIQHTGPFEGFSTSLTINTSAYHNSGVMNRHYFGSLHSHVTKGSSSRPVPINTTLVPITRALDLSYWIGVLDLLIGSGECPSTISEAYIQTVQQNMISALKQYPAYLRYNGSFSYNDASLDRPLQVPVTWPHGTYTLMQTRNGCPATGVTWATGSRFQDTEDVRGDNGYSSGIANYLKGTFHSNNIELHYCTKRTLTSSTYRRDWPAGNYCIMKHGNCPTGFSQGYIHWDDDDTFNKDRATGVLPDGVYDSNTRIFYCCRSDGPYNTAVSLPIDRPFVLLRYKGTCQAVYGTTMHELRIQWDDEDFFNKDSSSGAHPMDDGNSHEHILHFCFYARTGGGTPIIG